MANRSKGKATSSRRTKSDPARDTAEAGTFVPFQNFTVKQWTDWLNAFLGHEPCTPVLLLARDEAYHRALIRLFQQLNGKGPRDRFAEAIKDIYEATPLIAANAETLYYLIQLIAFTKPLGAKQLVRRDLLRGALQTISYGPMALHTLLLVAYGQYDVDDVLVDYIYRSSKKASTYGYLLACLHVLSARDAEVTFRFLERMLPRLQSEVERVQLGRQLKIILRRLGHSAFYSWFLNAPQNQPGRNDEQWTQFKSMLQDVVLPPWNAALLPEQDPYAVLLAAQLQADRRLLNPDELLAVARLYKEIDSDAIINALTIIWRKTAHRSYFQIPWNYDAASSYPQAFRDASPRMISLISDEVSFNIEEPKQDYAGFDAAREPELDRIFNVVKLECEFGGGTYQMESASEQPAETQLPM
jgi:hypothetical protein